MGTETPPRNYAFHLLHLHPHEGSVIRGICPNHLLSLTLKTLELSPLYAIGGKGHHFEALRAAGCETPQDSILAGSSELMIEYASRAFLRFAARPKETTC